MLEKRAYMPNPPNNKGKMSLGLPLNPDWTPFPKFLKPFEFINIIMIDMNPESPFLN